MSGSAVASTTGATTGVTGGVADVVKRAGGRLPSWVALALAGGSYLVARTAAPRSTVGAALLTVILFFAAIIALSYSSTMVQATMSMRRAACAARAHARVRTARRLRAPAPTGHSPQNEVGLWRSLHL